MKIEITDENFKGEVLESGVPVLVDFWAPWCGPCKVMSPIIEELGDEIDAAQMKIGACNVDESPKAPQEYGVMSIPTFIVFKDGKEVDRVSGSMEKEDLKERIMKHVA